MNKAEVKISSDRFAVINIVDDTMTFIGKRDIEKQLSFFCEKNSLSNRLCGLLIDMLDYMDYFVLSDGDCLYTTIMGNLQLIVIDTFRQEHIDEKVISFAINRQRELILKELLDN